jgi:hypothetical protein
MKVHATGGKERKKAELCIERKIGEKDGERIYRKCNKMKKEDT